MKKQKRKLHSPHFYNHPFLLVLVVFVLVVFARKIYLDLRPFSRLAIPAIPQVTNLKKPDKPNIVLILLDDLDDTVTPFWEALPATKKLLKDRGMTFINSFSPNPLCCPARASLLTGKYSHNTGVYNNAGTVGGWQKFFANGNEEKTIAVYLQNAGYKTIHIGKYLNGLEDNPTHLPAGWSEWYGGVGRAIYTGNNYTLNENGKLVKYGNNSKDYLTDVISQKALNFLKDTENTDDTPFFLSLAPTAPHYPLPPAERHRNHPFKKAYLPARQNFNEDDLSDKSSWLRGSSFTRSLFVLTSEWDYRQRMGSLYAADEMIAKVIDTLYINGELDNTYIIFTSDNGYNNGAHKLIQKMAPYDESIRVPLIITGPGIKNTADERFALTIDLAPTILNLSGLNTPKDMDGMSLVPILFAEDSGEWRSDFISQHKIGGLASEFVGYPWLLDFVTNFIDVPTYTALRTKDYLYIEYDVEHIGKEYELYDLKKDKYQLNNLMHSGNNNYKNIIKELKQRLEVLKTCSGDNCKLQ